PAATGIVLTGAGKYRCTAAIQIVGSASAGSGGNTALWNYGIWIGNTSVSQYGVLDTTNASTSYGVLGTHSYGVDLQGSTCATGVRLGNAQSLSSRNGANTADLELLRLDASNNVSLGLGAAAVFVGGAGSALLPQVDNSMPLGAASNRWSVVYAVNGTIQTSDGNLKTDVQPLPAALPIVAAVNPIRFRWKSGGNVLQEVMEEQEVQETETTYEDAVRLIDGVPTLVKNAIKHERGVADYVQVRDSSGMPVTHRQRGQDVPLLHPVPRMVKKQVPVQKLVSRAGIRTHWGFIASDIKAATPEGSDWGAYVKMEDGTEGLRPDQLIPVLWKAVQELAAEIAALKASAQKTGLGGT
ncbi:MAG: tail fiber domain-containing protein, partial [Bradyrhizobium sp.]